jgi:hypothetical protein
MSAAKESAAKVAFDTLLHGLKNPDRTPISQHPNYDPMLVAFSYPKFFAVFNELRQKEIEILEAKDGIFDHKTGMLKIGHGKLSPLARKRWPIADLSEFVTKLALALIQFDPYSQIDHDEDTLEYLIGLMREAADQISLRTEMIPPLPQKEEVKEVIEKIRENLEQLEECFQLKQPNQRSWTNLRLKLHEIFTEYLPPEITKDAKYGLMISLVQNFYLKETELEEFEKYFNIITLRRFFSRYDR